VGRRDQRPHRSRRGRSANGPAGTRAGRRRLLARQDGGEPPGPVRAAGDRPEGRLVSQKRILHIIPTLDRSGAEKQLTLLAAGLPRDQFDVHVCALTRGGPLVADLESRGIPCTVIGKRWKIDPLAYWRLQQHIARLRPALV